MRFTQEQMRKIRKHLETARDASTLENANLYPFDKESDAKMQELRKLVHLHHKTWITLQLDVALAELEKGK